VFREETEIGATPRATVHPQHQRVTGRLVGGLDEPETTMKIGVESNCCCAQNCGPFETDSKYTVLQLRVILMLGQMFLMIFFKLHVAPINTKCTLFIILVRTSNAAF